MNRSRLRRLGRRVDHGDADRTRRGCLVPIEEAVGGPVDRVEGRRAADEADLCRDQDLVSQPGLRARTDETGSETHYRGLRVAGEGREERLDPVRGEDHELADMGGTAM